MPSDWNLTSSIHVGYREALATWCEFGDIDLAKYCTDKLLLVYILLLCLPKVLGTFSLTIDFMIV